MNSWLRSAVFFLENDSFVVVYAFVGFGNVFVEAHGA